MSPMNTPHSLPVTVRGVFGYLDAILSKDVLELLAVVDLDRHGMIAFPHACTATSGVAKRIEAEFRLTDAESPLRRALAPFKLYHPDDITLALTWAYCLNLRGLEPLDALTADYGASNHGILQWRSVEEVKAIYPDGWMWNQFAPHFREGDRFVAYSLGFTTGTLLVRGDRLVLEVRENFLNYDSIPTRWHAAVHIFETFGGWRAFLAGKFDWPPENWEERFPEMIHGTGRLKEPVNEGDL
jgi:hypothetical protein